MLYKITDMIKKGALNQKNQIKEETDYHSDIDSEMNKTMTKTFTTMKKNDTQSVDLLLEVSMRMEMDRTNVIESFEGIGMADPFKTETSLKEAI